MEAGVVRGLDLAAAAAAVLTGSMVGVYVQVVTQQEERPLAWVVAWLVLCALAAAYGVRTAAAGRRWVLLGAGVALLALGLLAILSIGLPILAAGALALVAAARPAGEQPSP